MQQPGNNHDPGRDRRETVVLADGQEVVRAGTRLTLERAGFAVVAEVADVPAAVRALSANEPDLCLLDVRLPGGGSKAIEQIERASPRTTVVLFSEHVDEAEMLDALRAGAAGYLPKTMSPERLGATLRGALHGEAALPRELVGSIVAELRRRPGTTAVSVPGRPRVALTRREFEVLALLREGLSTKEAAGRLGVSAVTVRRHVAAIVRKLDVPNRTAALELLAHRGSND